MLPDGSKPVAVISISASYEVVFINV